MPLHQLIEANKGRFTQEELIQNIRTLSTGPNAEDPLIVKCRSMYQALFQQHAWKN